MVNIAVMGYGTVGSGVIEVLQTNKERIDQRAGDEIHVKYILDLREYLLPQTDAASSPCQPASWFQ